MDGFITGPFEIDLKFKKSARGNNHEKSFENISKLFPCIDKVTEIYNKKSNENLFKIDEYLEDNPNYLLDKVNRNRTNFEYKNPFQINVDN